MNEETIVEVKKPRSGAVSKVRAEITSEPKTISNLKELCSDLSAEQISMALSYLLKKEVVIREKTDRTAKTGRRLIWSYVLAQPAISAETNA